MSGSSWSPRTLDEALALRAEHPGVPVVAGGTDLMVALNRGRSHPGALLDLSHVEELQSWERDRDLVRVGAGVTFARIAAELDDQTALVEAARTVGSPQIRNRATLGGNIATASPAGDGLAALAAYDATIVVADSSGERRIPWQEFLRGPKRTALGPRELVVAAEWEPVDGPGTFAKIGPRGAMVIAVAGVCMQLDEERQEVRIALGSVGPTVLRARAAEASLAALGWGGSDDRSVADAASLAAVEAAPIDDLRGTAAYRRHAVAVLVRRSLQRLLAERGSLAA